jgi:hypothetical protein
VHALSRVAREYRNRRTFIVGMREECDEYTRPFL